MSITHYDSHNFVMSRVLMGQDNGQFHIGCAYLNAGGRIGLHQATSNQLLLVVQGEGWVSGEDVTKVPIAVGQAAFWVEGEWHETGTETGLTALIIEGSSVWPERMTEINSTLQLNKDE